MSNLMLHSVDTSSMMYLLDLDNNCSVDGYCVLHQKTEGRGEGIQSTTPIRETPHDHMGMGGCAAKDKISGVCKQSSQ